MVTAYRIIRPKTAFFAGHRKLPSDKEQISAAFGKIIDGFV